MSHNILAENKTTDIGYRSRLALFHLRTGSAHVHGIAGHHTIAVHKWFSDKIYWQVADQPGKEGPDSLVMVDLEGKEENKDCHP